MSVDGDGCEFTDVREVASEPDAPASTGGGGASEASTTGARSKEPQQQQQKQQQAVGSAGSRKLSPDKRYISMDEDYTVEVDPREHDHFLAQGIPEEYHGAN